MYSKNANMGDSLQTKDTQDLTLSSKSISPPLASLVKRKHKGGNRLGLKNFARWKKNLLIDWLKQHKEQPYPSDIEKEELARICQLSTIQVSNWFTNARKR